MTDGQEIEADGPIEPDGGGVVADPRPAATELHDGAGGGDGYTGSGRPCGGAA